MKINAARIDAIEAALNIVQHNARVRTVSALDIDAMVDRIETFLEDRMYKKDWHGLRFVLDPNGQAFPNAYKGVPESTQVLVERFRTGWFVTKVLRRPAQTHEITALNLHKYGEQLAEHAASPQVWDK